MAGDGDRLRCSCVVQGAAVAGALPAGPFDTVGSFVLWPDRVSVVDIVAPLAAIGITMAGFALLERFSLEQLVRRSALVAQLRFAVTLQDVRTVTLLRRQLSLEHARHRPWFTFPGGGPASWRRSWASIARFPGRRIVRMLLLTGGTAGMAVAAYRGTTPAIVPAGLLAFLLGLEALEPLAQELDHPERTDALPVARRSAAPAPDDRPGARAAAVRRRRRRRSRCSSSGAPMRSSSLPCSARRSRSRAALVRR